MKKPKVLLGAILLSLNCAVFAVGITTTTDAAPDTSIAATTTYNYGNFNPGIYIGGQLGSANLHYHHHSDYTLPTNSADNFYFAGRAYFGYAFSQYISAELGYDYYGRPKFTHDPSGNTQDFVQQGADLVGKATLPLDYGFGFFIKAGANWIHRGPLHSNKGFFAQKDDNSKFVPVGSIGASYAIASNIALDVSWTRTVKIGDLPTIDFFAGGFTYRFNI